MDARVTLLCKDVIKNVLAKRVGSQQTCGKHTLKLVTRPVLSRLANCQRGRLLLLYKLPVVLKRVKQQLHRVNYGPEMLDEPGNKL